MKAPSKDFRHPTPVNLQTALDRNPSFAGKWESLTPLCRNEWICWMTSPKLEATRANHLARLEDEVLDGKRRPCCWPGCPHRRESARKWFKD